MPLTLSAAQLRTTLATRYPRAHLLILDTDYHVPTEHVMAGYNEELRYELWQKYGDKWESYFDCENFSLEALALANRKHYLARRAGAGHAQGIAFGLLGYLLEPANPGTGHCIAFRVDAQQQVREFEPQNRQPLTLTPEQCTSAFFALVS